MTDLSDKHSETLDRGAIFVTTGENYTRLAIDAARSVRTACPGLAVDLFVDTETATSSLKSELEDIFDQIHLLEDPWHRSKIDGMSRSRFARTLYLDADLRVVSDLRDVFDLLDRFHLALAHDQWRNAEVCQLTWRMRLPDAYPQFNGGVIAYRRTPEVLDFLADWKAAVKAHGIGRDQPALRELLWQSDLRVAVLPQEYNLLDWPAMQLWGPVHPGPRIIHSTRFHVHFTTGNGRQAVTTLDDLVGPRLAARMPALIAADHGLARRAGRNPTPFAPLRGWQALTVLSRGVKRRLARTVARLTRRQGGGDA